MPKQNEKVPNLASTPRRYCGTDIPLRVIRAYARGIANRFHPDKIILFGSHAYGSPHVDSDVDILVVMRAEYELGQALKIRLAVPAPFPMDLLVSTPANMRRRLAEGESFMTEVVNKGKVLYEKGNARVGAQSRGGSAPRVTHRARRRAVS